MTSSEGVFSERGRWASIVISILTICVLRRFKLLIEQDALYYCFYREIKIE